MLFNSIEFAVFAVVVFFLYWFLGRRSGRSQNIILLGTSIFFYGYADLRFLSLILFNVIINYLLGLSIRRCKSESKQQLVLITGLLINIGILCYFKYFNFFYDSIIDLLAVFGSDFAYSSLKILLPLGISFYTFQSIGYLLDIYNEEIEPCDDPLAFATYLTYFPKIVAGPIERAQRFLPQISHARQFDYQLAADGCRQFLWGLFAKVVLANGLENALNPIFDNVADQRASTLLVGAFLYLFYMYCDFSGYTNMALGISKLFGIRLSINFATPLFSTSISDFWRRWHISLSTWAMDYLYTPLTFIFRSYGKAGTMLAISITFFVIGIWHGAAWAYVAFGVLQAIYFIPLVTAGSVNQVNNYDDVLIPSPVHALKMLFMLCIIALAFLLLKTESVSGTLDYISAIVSADLFSRPEKFPGMLMMIFALFMLTEWLQRNREHALDIARIALPYRHIIYIVLLIMVFGLGEFDNSAFVYKQF